MSFKLSLWSGYYPEFTPEAAVDAYTQAGFRYMELSCNMLHDLMKREGHHVGSDFCRYANDRGLSITQGHLSYLQGLCVPGAVDLLKGEIDFFQEVGVPNLIIHFNGGNDLSPEEKQATRLKALSEVADYVKGTETNLCLENLGSVPETHTVERLRGIIDTVGSNRLAICLDIGHLHLVNGRREAVQSQKEFIYGAGDLLKALHVHGNSGTIDDHLMPFSARFGPDWVEVMRSLREVGYEGLFNLEIGGERFMPLPIRIAKLRYIKEMADYLISDEFLA